MKRFFVLFAFTIALFNCATSPDQKQAAGASAASSAAPYSAEATTMPVGVIPAAVIHDPQRNKDLGLSIDYPTRGGPYPVVIFSHGYGVPRNAYIALSAFWAGRGYVVIRPHHADLGALGGVERTFAEPPRDRRSRRPPAEQRPAEFRADPSEQWQTQTAADWKNRVMDVTFTIDSLPKLVEQYPEIKERVDSTRIGVGGHSYGAFVAMLVAGAKTFAGGNAVTYSDPRVKALVAMSPPGPSPERGLTRDSFSTIAIPALFLTGSRDFGAVEAEDPAWRKQAFELSPGPDKWFVSAAGIGSAAFTGIIAAPPPPEPTPTPLPPTVRRPGPLYPDPQAQPSREPSRGFRPDGMAGSARTVSLAFWDAYLKNEAAGRNFLTNLLQRSDLQVESK